MSTIILLWVLCTIGAGILNAGALLPMFQAAWVFENRAQRFYRFDLGMACLFGGVAALVWPIGVPAIACFTGFYTTGWRIVRLGAP